MLPLQVSFNFNIFPSNSSLNICVLFCRNLEALKSNPHYEYIQPPVGQYSSSKFILFKEIYNAGYHHGNTFFCGLKKAGKSKWLPPAGQRSRASGEPSYSFTDLAAMVVSGTRVGREWAAGAGREGGEDSEKSDDTGIVM